MANSRSTDIEYRDRLLALKDSVGEQAKELAVPIAVDLVSALTGMWIGRQMGRASLLVGVATLAGGKFHSLHETINREEQRMGTYDEEKRPMLSGYNPLYKNENRVYHGESPLVPLGLGLMFGGAFSDTNPVSGVNGEELSATEKAKTAFKEIADDLKYRLYLDKIFKDKKKENSTDANKGVSGLSEIDVFIAGDKLLKDLDTTKLDELEKKIEDSAVKFDSSKSPASKEAPEPKSPAGTKAQSDEAEMMGELSTTRIM